MNDSEQKFVISPSYSLPKPNEIFDLNSEEHNDSEEFKKITAGELFVLMESTSNRTFLINPTIHFFLQAFTEPTTLDKVSLLFAQEAKCTVAEIEEFMKSFLHRMQKRKVVLKEEDAAKITPQEPLKPKEEYAQLKAGDSFKDYTVHSLLSIRNESQLYLLEDKNKDIYVLKILFFHPSTSQSVRNEFTNKFRKEFDMLKELKGHPSICSIKLYEDGENESYGIMEYIDGISLRKYVKENEMTMSQKLTMIRSIIDTIQHVQEKGVLHGDIHNSNFMVNTAGEIKLIDFGLSNHVEPNEDEILRNGGKNSFIPPERISFNSFEFLSQRADYTSEVFQLGVLAYYVLFKDLPFKGFTWKSLGHNITHQAPDFTVTSTNPEDHISDELIAVLHKSMAKNPAERYETALSFLEAFDHVTQLETAKA